MKRVFLVTILAIVCFTFTPASATTIATFGGYDLELGDFITEVGAVSGGPFTVAGAADVPGAVTGYNWSYVGTLGDPGWLDVRWNTPITPDSLIGLIELGDTGYFDVEINGITIGKYTEGTGQYAGDYQINIAWFDASDFFLFGGGDSVWAKVSPGIEDIQDLLFPTSFTGGFIINPTDVGAVPIPAPILLLGTGLIGMVGFRRKFSLTS